jgi:hypothetical protein
LTPCHQCFGTIDGENWSWRSRPGEGSHRGKEAFHLLPWNGIEEALITRRKEGFDLPWNGIEGALIIARNYILSTLKKHVLVATQGFHGANKFLACHNNGEKVNWFPCMQIEGRASVVIGV